MSINLQGLSYIGYSRASQSGKPTRAMNPATNSEIEPAYFWGTAEDVSRAAQLAASAFAEYRLPHWLENLAPRRSPCGGA